MLKLLSTAAVAMILSVPAGFTGTSPVQAQEFQLYIGPDGVRLVAAAPRYAVFDPDEAEYVSPAATGFTIRASCG